DARDEPHGECLGGAHLRGRKEEELRARRADPAREPRAEEAVGHAAQQLRGPERGALGGDGEVGGEGQVEPAALAGAVDAEHDDLWTTLKLHEREQVDAVRLAVEARTALVPSAHLAADAEVVAS